VFCILFVWLRKVSWRVGIFFFFWRVGRVLFYVGHRVGKQVTAIISRKTKKIILFTYNTFSGRN